MCSSFVFIHIGQCGVQVGSEFWTSVLGCLPKHVPGLFLRSSKYPLPCILSDSEPKAVRRSLLCSREMKRTIHPLNIVTSKRGCGNNWGCGYRDNLSCCIIERLRRTAESCDNFMGVVIFHSTSGGTGSGACVHPLF